MYDRSVVILFRGGELVVIRISECREYLSVYNESGFLPPSFGAAKFTFCSRQILCMPGRLRSDGGDADHDRRMLIENCRDGSVVHVDEFIIRSGISTECANGVSSESTLVNGLVLSVIHFTFRTRRLRNTDVAFDHMVIGYKICRSYRRGYHRRNLMSN